MTQRARAITIALRRRPEPSPWLAWVVLAFLLLAGLSAHGQTVGGGATIQPNAPVPTVPAPDGNSNGVLRPAVPMDPGIHAASPSTSVFPMPVVKPPGTPGGDTTVMPK